MKALTSTEIPKNDSDSGQGAKVPPSIDGGVPKQSRPFAKSNKQGTGGLYSQAGQELAGQNSAGLGAEGGSQAMLAVKALAMVHQGLQMLSAVLPGIIPVTSDVMGRLEMMVPQMMQDLQNGGSGMMASAAMGPNAGAPPMGAQPMGPAMPPQGAPPMGPGGPVAPQGPPPPVQG